MSNRFLIVIAPAALCMLFIGMPLTVFGQSSNSTSTATVSGQVFDDAGTAIANASVDIYKADNSFGSGTITGSDGSYSITVLPGSYKIQVRPPYGTLNLISSGPEDISLSAGEFRTQSLYLLKAVKGIKGKVSRTDGTPVTNARVQAFRQNIYVDTQTDSSGNYTLFVSGGYWSVFVFPQATTDWIYEKSPVELSFNYNTASEEKTVNFTVTTVEASVRGRILRPDGTPLAKGMIDLSFQGSQGSGYYAGVDESGSFTVQLPAGTYSIYINVRDTGFSGPIMNPVTVAKGDAKDLGTIYLVKATKTIRGIVTRPDGTAVTDARVSAKRGPTQGFAETETSSSGNYTLLVTGGTWEIYVSPRGSTADWSYVKPTQLVVFTDDASAEEKIINFTVANIDASVKGRILLADGNPPAINTVSVNLYSETGDSFYGNPDIDGYISIGTAAGTYRFHVWSRDPAWIPPEPLSVTIAKGETKELGTITLVRATKIIKGKVRFPDGTAVTDAGVNAYREDTQQSVYTTIDPAGDYILHVSGGNWGVSVNPQITPSGWAYIGQPPSAIFINDLSTEEKIVDFVVTPTDARVRGYLYRPDGTPPPQETIWISLGPREADISQGPVYRFGGRVYPSGLFEIEASAGTFEFFAEIKDSDLIAPVLVITLAKGEVKEVGNIYLIKPPKKVTGAVKYPDGRGVIDAYVNAYQSGAPNRQIKTDSQGNYTLLVTGGIWEMNLHSATSSPDWVYSYQPVYASFANDSNSEEKKLNFTVISADAKVKGKIVKADGTAPSREGVYVDFQTETGINYGGGPVDLAGAFLVSLPSGSYRLNIWSQDPSNIGPDFPSFTLAKGEVKDLGAITLIKPAKLLKGRVLREDGRPIGSARIGAFRQETQRFVEAKTDSSGKYSLQLPGGVWEISIDPTTPMADWTYAKPPETIIFAKDSSSEEKTLDFTVRTADSFIVGKVLKPDGSVPSAQSVFVGAKTAVGPGMGFGGPVDASGAFRIPTVAGIYSVFIGTQDPNYGSPTLPQVTVASGETKDLGEIRLIERKDHIKGKVLDKDGIGINGVEVVAFEPAGSGFAYTKTKLQGEYDLLVTPGNWEASARPDPSTNLYSIDPPQRVAVVSGAVSAANFVLHLADARITGQIVDENGSSVSDVFGFVDMSQETVKQERFDFFFGGVGLGGPVEHGTFTFSVPSGSYNLSLFLPPDSSYTPGSSQKVTIASGETISVKVAVHRNTSKITGALKNENGQIVTGVPASIFASNKNGVWREVFADTLTGAFSLSIASGTWYLGLEIDSASGYIASQHDIEVRIGDNQTVAKDMVLIKAGSIITGQVTDPGGRGAERVFVSASKSSLSAEQQDDDFDSFVSGADTDAAGNYKIAVPAGVYYLRTFTPPEMGFMNAAEERTSVEDGQSIIVNLKLRKSDSRITGKVFTDNNVSVSESFVWGWSADGGYQDTISRSDGSYILNIIGSTTWRVGASKDIGSVLYEAREKSMFVGTTSITHDFVLEKGGELPAPTIKTVDSSLPLVVTAAGGVSVAAPANSFAGGGPVSLSITPDARAPSQGEISVIGIAYDIEARDSSGQIISSFDSSVTLSMPYQDSEVLDKGVKEEGLEIGFWDESISMWGALENCVVNKEDNSVTCKTTHFTRFAIVSAADITPPAAPSNISARAIGGGKVELGWTSPAKDFHSVIIYRSEIEGVSGPAILRNFVGSTTVDTGLADGTVYYYLIRAVDPAGNESINAVQQKVTVVGTSIKVEEVKKAAAEEKKLPAGQAVKLEILRSLKLGSEGGDVKILQDLLVKEGVYPEGLVTGYFGDLTKRAVVRLQEKYSSEILAPAGLKKGTGFVGPSTAKKINELLSFQSGDKQITTAPLPAIKTILRNLTKGNRGDEVVILQEFLVKEGVYPEAIVTGFFGALTEKAVIRFQEKYSSEILAPAGLEKGTGFVGNLTRKKINDLAGR